MDSDRRDRLYAEIRWRVAEGDPAAERRAVAEHLAGSRCRPGWTARRRLQLGLPISGLDHLYLNVPDLALQLV